MSNKVKEIIGEYKYGFKTEVKNVLSLDKGLNEEIVKAISTYKKEPSWMMEYRLKSYHSFLAQQNPKFGPKLDHLNYNDYTYYIKASERATNKWEDVPEAIKDTFEKLGIPEAERKFLAGVSTQFESEVVYHSVLQELESLGVIFTDTDTALQ